jgi:DNA-binding CsgD family transcriptional regulator/tetratricopeptide (TPR) repeat protein/energy-coupling factor transporter ATP-binding protein EcfA2
MLHPSFPFVGRAHELQSLEALVPTGSSEGRRMVLVGGEPGSGKSRLVRELASLAKESGARVVEGGCDAVFRTPYQPFTEALGTLIRSLPDDIVAAVVGARATELARILPALASPTAAAPVSSDPDTERHRTHIAVGDLLRAAGETRPLVLLLEDCHWADVATLHLLRHLARPGEGRLLVVATFRDTEADVPTELAETLADLRRSEAVVRLRLAGLTTPEIDELVCRLAGTERAAQPDIVAAIGELTAGNPFLITELWRALQDSGAIAHDGDRLRLVRPLADVATPEGVREVVGQRIARVAPGTRDLLDLAATIGPVFDVEVVRAAGGFQRGALLKAVDEAASNGLIEEAGGRGFSYRFAHELVRRAVYDRLSGLRRAELHLRVAEVLEQQPHTPAAELAHHFGTAVPLTQVERAVHYHGLAAEAAMVRLAYDVAAEHLGTALDLGVADARERACLELRRGEALMRCGSSLDALDAYRRAAAIGRDEGDCELLARAAIGYENACWRPAFVDRGARELLEEALAGLDPGTSQLRGHVQAGLARACDFVGDIAAASAARADAIACARSLDDRRGLATVLMRSYWARSSEPMAEINAKLDEAIQIGAELGDVEIQTEAMQWHVASLLGLGDLATARRELEVAVDLASRSTQPFLLHAGEHYRSAIALADGRLDEAAAAAQRSHEWSRLLTGRDASGIYGVQMFNIRREQGRLGRLAPVVRVLARESTGLWQPGFAALLTDLRLEDEAREVLRTIRGRGLDHLRQGLWLASLVYLSDAVTRLGDARFAEVLYAELEPFAGTNVMIGHGVALLGSADRYLGMLAATSGDLVDAERRFVSAEMLDRAMDSATWTAHTLAERGLALGDEVALRDALALAGHHGLARVAERIGHVAPSPPAVPLPDDLSPREVTVLCLVAGGGSNRQIGDHLVISEHTVANHVRSILRKTGCANRTEAAAYAYRRGLVEHVPGR